MTISSTAGRSPRFFPRIGKVAAGVLAGLLVAGSALFLASPAHAAEVSTVVDGMTFTADDGNVGAGATVTDFDGSTATVTIPSTVTIGGTAYSVTSIGDEAFLNNALTSVTIPDSVTTIGDHALYGNYLTSVSIPDSVISIDDYAFAYNTLTSLTIPNSVTTIGFAAFEVNSLTSVTIGNSVTTIGDDAFGVNLGLTAVAFQGPPPTRFGAAGAGGSFGNGTELVVSYPFEYDAANYPGGYTTPTWQGYTTTTTIPILTVSFDSAGGSAVADQAVQYGDPATQPTDPTRTGFDFAGWYTGGSQWDFTQPVTENTTLTAHWTPITPTTFTVIFDSAGGSTIPDQVVDEGDPVTEPAAPTRTGYDFAGWYTDGSPWDFTRPVTENTTLTAHWTPITLTVTFDSAGGSTIPDQTVDYGDPATQPTAPTRTGYDFAGWYADGIAWDFTQPVTGNMTLTAHWTPITLTVSFDSAGGSTIPDQTVDYGDPATQPTDPTRTGYDFTGWYTDGSPWDFTQPVTQDMTLTAHWTLITLTVTFDSNGGSAVPDQTVDYGDPATQPTDPTRPGFNFAGWYTDGTAWDFTQPITENTTLTAHWTPITFTVSFDSNGGSAVPDQTVDYGDPATQPTAPTRTGYDFTGWYTGGTAWDFTQPVTENTTLTAHWTPITLTVTFDSAGGGAVPDQTVDYGDPATQPTDPTRTGYDFTGWYADGSPWDFTQPVTENTTLTAHWTAVAVPAGTASRLANTGSGLGVWPLAGLALILAGLGGLALHRRGRQLPHRN